MQPFDDFNTHAMKQIRDHALFLQSVVHTPTEKWRLEALVDAIDKVLEHQTK